MMGDIPPSSSEEQGLGFLYSSPARHSLGLQKGPLVWQLQQQLEGKSYTTQQRLMGAKMATCEL